MGDYLRGVGGIDPLDPKHDWASERERQEKRGRDSQGREYSQQEEDESHISDRFQEKAPPILPTSPKRKFRVVHSSKEESGVGRWAKERLNHLSIRERVGQLLFLVVGDGVDEDDLVRLVEQYQVGGLFFAHLRGSFEHHTKLVARLQSASNTPLIIGASASSKSHFDEMAPLPLLSTIGRIADKDLLVESGEMIGDYYHRLGFHAALLPLVESAPDLVEKVGGDLFLSDDRDAALERGIALMKGVLKGGALPVAQTCMRSEEKEETSDEDWLIGQLLRPLSSFGYEQIRPFRKMAQSGLEHMLLPHMYFPIFVGKELSGDVGLLFGHLLHTPQWQERVMVGEEGLEQTLELLLTAVSDGALTRGELDDRALAILRAKEVAGFDEPRESAPEQLSREALDQRHRTLYSHAVSVRLNEMSALPLPEHVGLIEVDAPGETHFRQMIEARSDATYCSTTPFHLESRKTEEGIIEQMQDRRWVVVAVYKERSLSPHLFELLHRLRALNKKVVLVAFLPFRLLKGVGRESAYLVANEAEPAAQLAAAERLYQA